MTSITGNWARKQAVTTMRFCSHNTTTIQLARISYLSTRLPLDSGKFVSDNFLGHMKAVSLPGDTAVKYNSKDYTKILRQTKTKGLEFTPTVSCKKNTVRIEHA